VSTAVDSPLAAWDRRLAATLDELGDVPTPPELGRLADELAAAAGRHELPTRPAPSGDRVVLVGGDGPVLGIADFAAAEPTTIHDHGMWGVGLVLAGTDRLERFERSGPRARLVDVHELRPGDTFVIGPPPDDVHRQHAVGGPVRELLLFRADPHRYPRTDHVAADGPVERAVAALLHGDRAALHALYAPDVQLDADGPRGRHRAVGPGAADALRRLGLEASGRRCTMLRRTDTGHDVLVETEVHLGDGHRRDRHRLVFAGGRIVEHVVHGTGIGDDAARSTTTSERPRR
jgi:hypothetical protein